jgi:hypothetical protein
MGGCGCLWLQVLLGRDNPFARAVAQGNVSDHSPMLEAVAYDLDTLQVGILDRLQGNAVLI